MEDIANAWRTGQDGQANWASVMKSVDHTEPLWSLAGPNGPIGGHWNGERTHGHLPHEASLCDACELIILGVECADADMLECGNVGLSEEESRSMMALFAFLHVPLMVSNDLRKMMQPEHNTTLAMVTNAGLIRLNQDRLGYPGRRIRSAKPVPPAPDHVISLRECTGADAQRWRQVVHHADHEARSGEAQHSIEFLHRDSEYALTVPDPSCSSGQSESVATSGLSWIKSGVPLVLAYSNASNSCGGRNQRWIVRADGTIMSLLNGHCIDVDGAEDPSQPLVQLLPCATATTAGTASASTNQTFQLNGSTIRWGGPGFHQCICGHCVGQPPPPAAGGGGGEVWEKQLSGGDVAILLLNRAETPLNISAHFDEIPRLNQTVTVGSAARVYDVWAAQDNGIARGSLSRIVPAHGTVVLRLQPVE